MPSFHPSRRVLVLLVVLAYWAVLLAATHWPAGHDAKQPRFRHLDKLQHLAAFAILAAISLAAAACYVPPGPTLYFGVFALIGSYAAVDEWTQRWVQNRTGDPLDWLFDVLGALLGIVAFDAVSKWRARKG